VPGAKQILHAFSDLEACFSGLKQLQIEAAAREAELARRTEEHERERSHLQSKLEENAKELSRLRTEREMYERERSDYSRRRQMEEREREQLTVALRAAQEARSRIAAEAAANTERADLAEQRAADAEAKATEAAERLAKASQSGADTDRKAHSVLKKADEARVAAEKVRDAAVAELESVRQRLEAAEAAAAQAKKGGGEAERQTQAALRQAVEARTAAEKARDAAVVEAESLQKRLQVAEAAATQARKGGSSESELHLKTTLRQTVEARTAAERARDAALAEVKAAQERAEAAEKHAAELEKRTARASQDHDSARKMGAEAEQRVKAALQQAEQLRREVAESQKAAEAEAAGTKKKLAAAAAELSARDAQCAHLKGQVEKLEGRVKELQATTVPTTEARKLDGSMQELAAKLKQSEERRAALEAELDQSRKAYAQAQAAAVAASGGQGADRPTQKVELRRQRLHRYKELLQTQARKIVAAQKSLQQRQDECEQILAQRANLEEAARELASRGTGAKAAGRAAVIVVACCVVIFGVLGWLSWFAAGKMAPPTWVARAVVKTDSKGKAPSRESVEAWTAYHQSILQDPQLMEVAAERLDRRGLAEFGKAPLLRARLKTSLSGQSSVPGTMTIDLRGQGARKTADVLDTYVSALLSVVNANKAQRPDGLGTLLDKPAAIAGEPLEDQRPTYAAGILGMASVVVFALGGLVFFKLLGRRREQAVPAAVADVIDQRNWPSVAA
jgi:hypothetical protein